MQVFQGLAVLALLAAGAAGDTKRPAHSRTGERPPQTQGDASLPGLFHGALQHFLADASTTLHDGAPLASARLRERNLQAEARAGRIDGLKTIKQASPVKRLPKQQGVEFDISFDRLSVHYDDFEFSSGKVRVSGPIDISIGKNLFRVTVRHQTPKHEIISPEEVTVTVKMWQWEKVDLPNASESQRQVVFAALYDEKFIAEKVKQAVVPSIESIISGVYTTPICYTC